MTSFELSDSQFRKLMRDKVFKRDMARAHARAFHAELLAEFGEWAGKRFLLPLSLAGRLSGFNETWIRRNLPVVKVDGQHDSIEFGDLVDAFNKGKGRAS